MGYSELLAAILKSLLEGAASEGGSEAFGFILSFIGENNNEQFDQVQGQLQTLQDDVEALKIEVEDIEKELVEILKHMDWNTDKQEISDSLIDITSHFETLQQMSQSDEHDKQALIDWATNGALWKDLDTLNEYLLPGGAGDPNDPGLVRMFAQANAEAAVQDPHYKVNGVLNIGAGSPLDVYYERTEQYFLYMFGVQMKGLTLLSNGYNAIGESDMAQAKTKDFAIKLIKQCQNYLSAIEAFAVYYAVDMSLQQVLSSAAETTDDPPVPVNPMRRAGLTIDRLNNAKTFYAWMWWGSGTDQSMNGGTSTVGTTAFDAFDDNPITTQNLPQLVNTSSGTTIAPTPLASGADNAYTAFPVNGSFQWAMLRFAWTNPPEGTYEIHSGGQQLTTLLIDNKPIVNLLIAPSQTRTFFNPARTFSFGLEGTDSPEPAVYFGCTSLWTKDNPCVGGSEANPRYSFPGDFSVEGFFYVTDRTNQYQTLLSNKCAYGAQSVNNGEPGASGFFLQYDWNDHLIFTVDNGLAYYKVTSAQMGLMDWRWHHVAAVRKNWQLSIYLDGKPLSVTASGSGSANTMALNNCWSLMLGSTNSNGNWQQWTKFSPGQQYTGYMNEVAVWTRALSQAEIQAHITQGITARAPGQLAYWPFTYARYDDISGNGSTVQNAAYHLALRPLPVCYPPATGAASHDEVAPAPQARATTDEKAA